MAKAKKETKKETKQETMDRVKNLAGKEMGKAKKELLKDFMKAKKLPKVGDIVKVGEEEILIAGVDMVGFDAPMGLVREKVLDLKVIKVIDGRLVSSFMSSEDI